jgi:nucleotide-binding universal stress UspA family protein
VEGAAAAAWLSAFPLPVNARALVLSVQGLPPSGLDIPTVRDFHRTLIDEARRAAGAAAAILKSAFQTIEVRVVTGDAREVIPRIAADWDADLIVIGARGLGALATAFLGSVSLAVARHAPCPVLIVRPTVRPLHSVVVALDGSPGAQRAVRFIAGLPLPTEVGIRLVAVVQPPRAPEASAKHGDSLAAAANRVTVARRRELEAAMDQAAERVGAVRAVREALVGQPAEMLAEVDADLIVLGARGLGTLKRLVLGSVSEDVLRHARCPVLIVRGDVLQRIARRRQTHRGTTEGGVVVRS